MSDLKSEVAVLNERVKQLAQRLESMSADVSDMKRMAERYRGGFLVIAALGSIIGMIAQAFNFFPWHPAPPAH